MLTEPLDLYLAQLEFDSPATETPYLFYPVQSGEGFHPKFRKSWMLDVGRWF